MGALRTNRFAEDLAFLMYLILLFATDLLDQVKQRLTNSESLATGCSIGPYFVD